MLLFKIPITINASLLRVMMFSFCSSLLSVAVGPTSASVSEAARFSRGKGVVVHTNTKLTIDPVWIWSRSECHEKYSSDSGIKEAGNFQIQEFFSPANQLRKLSFKIF